MSSKKLKQFDIRDINESQSFIEYLPGKEDTIKRNTSTVKEEFHFQESKPKIILNDDEKISLNTTQDSQEIPKSLKKINIVDSYFDRLGYTKSHIALLVIVAFIFFVDGCEMSIINMIRTTLKDEWGLSAAETSFLASSIFLGFFIGSLFSAFINNQLGRKYPATAGLIIIWFFSTSCYFCNSYFYFLCLRICVGFGIGIMAPSLATLVTECLPTKFRSFVLNTIWILYPVGAIFICYLGILFTNDEGQLEWKNIFLVNSFTVLLALIGSFFIYESPRYLILMGQYEEAFFILDKFSPNLNTNLSVDEKYDIISQSEERKQMNEENKIKGRRRNSKQATFNLWEFFNNRYFTVTLLLAFLWYITSFVSYGILYILPKMLEERFKSKKSSFRGMASAMVIIVPCSIFRGIISELEFLGRRNAMKVGFVGCIFAGIACLVDPSNLVFSSGFMKFFINTSVGIVHVYTGEVYPISLRSFAIGFGNSITRMAGVIVPFACEFVYDYISPQAPFYMFILSAISGSIATMLLPFETMGKALDSFEETKEEKKTLNL
jgi:putative MFS transporter